MRTGRVFEASKTRPVQFTFECRGAEDGLVTQLTLPLTIEEERGAVDQCPRQILGSGEPFGLKLLFALFGVYL